MCKCSVFVSVACLLRPPTCEAFLWKFSFAKCQLQTWWPITGKHWLDLPSSKYGLSRAFCLVYMTCTVSWDGQAIGSQRVEFGEEDIIATSDANQLLLSTRSVRVHAGIVVTCASVISERHSETGSGKSTCMNSMQTGIMPCATFRTVPFQQSSSYSFKTCPL
jgi:hypothetical protein